MKKLYSFLICTFLMFSFQVSRACVDYHADSVYISYSGDTSGCNLEIRISNLQMFGGNPNQFCSCGVIGSYDLGPDKPFFIDFVVFVDAITNIPLDGFDAFNFLPAASTSWENLDPNAFDWSGFVSLVNSSGIVAGQDVDLVIRGHYEHGDCSIDMEYILMQEFQILSGGGFGTDEWSNANDDLALSHNDITYFDDIVEWDDVEYNFVEPDYFEFLDNLLLNQVDLNAAELMIYPNPAVDRLNMNLPFSTMIEIVDSHGRVVLNSYLERFSDINVSCLTNGLYIIRFQNKNAIYQSKFIKE